MGNLQQSDAQLTEKLVPLGIIGPLENHSRMVLRGLRGALISTSEVLSYWIADFFFKNEHGIIIQSERINRSSNYQSFKQL